ncbi:MAG: hypothetical protein KUG68_09835 [Flavobacteriaceae bacterium]|nr:hypothetical protein [Flavobacteriaceae bacterium]
MKKDIFQRIDEAGNPDFSDVLSKSFELFKKVWEQGFYHVLITMALVLPFVFLVYVPLIYIMSVTGGFEDPAYYDNNLEISYLLIAVYALVVFVMIFIIQALSFGLIAHFFRVCKKEDTGLPIDTGSYFVFLKGENLKKVFLLSLATFIISLVAMALCYLPIIYVLVPLNLFVVIFAFNEKLSVSDIIKASFKLGNKYWLIVFGLLIIASIIAQVGVLLCFIGMFFTAYFVHIPVYYFYKDSVGFEDELEEINF